MDSGAIHTHIGTQLQGIHLITEFRSLHVTVGFGTRGHDQRGVAHL